MSLYGDVLSGIRSIVLIDERVQRISGKIETMADQLHKLSTRVTRIETMIEIMRPDGSVLRVAPPKPRKPRLK